MKKTMVLVMMMVSIFTFGAAYAADNQTAAATGGTPPNGITYFDLGSSSTCDNLVKVVDGNAAKPFNGITAFDLWRPGSGSEQSCAGKSAQIIMSKGYNGITIF